MLGASRSKYLYIFDTVFLPANSQEGKNINNYEEELRKVLKFLKSHRKAPVPESVF